MGKIIVEQIISADGFAADKAGGIEYFDSAGDLSQLEPEQLEVLSHVDAMVLGANTYKMFVEYWPTADPAKEKVAEFINTRPKHVFSSKLVDAPWGRFEPAIVEKSDAARRLPELRERYGGDIIVWGSLMLSEALFRANLVDVLRLRIVPVLIGDGRSVAPAELAHTKLDLAASHSYPRGHVTLTYAVRR